MSATQEGARAAESASIGIILVDENACIRFVNASAESLLGRSRKQLKGRCLNEIGPLGETVYSLANKTLTEARTINAHDVEISLEKRHLRLSIDAAPEGEGACVCLRRWPEAGSSARSDLAANAAVGFGRLLSHELKNPIAGARGAAQLIAMNEDEETAELAQLIMTELDRARRISDRWSSVGDIALGPVAPVNMHALLRDVIQSAKRSGANSIIWREQFDPSIPDALADRDLVLQAILNLAINAAEAIGDAEGEVTLSTHYRSPQAGSPAPDAKIEIRVEDNGPGVDEALREAIFNPFVTSKPAGEGLGLSFVSRVAGLHGGGVECQSRPGNTVFYFYLKASTS